jgi:membrane-anchored mycosin MYCP
MRGGGVHPGKSVCATMTLLTVTAGTLAVGAPAFAAPTCQTSTVTPGQRITDTPWAQSRYAPGRLSSIADGHGVTVAVIDSGVDAEHPQLAGQVLGGADFLDRSGNGQLDCVGHGTAVASIIAADPASGIPFRGLAPGAKILPVRISEQQEIDGTASGQTVSASDFAKSIDWAVQHDAKVINLSVVMYKDDPDVRAAIGRAVDADVVVVAAAGNQNLKGNPRPYPAAYDGVLGVGAITQDGTRLPESQVGSYVDVVAPGDQVIAATSGGGLTRESGTSFAAPFAAAAAALVRQYWPALSAPQVIRRIMATTDPAPGGRRSNAYGNGVLNPYRAVTEELTSGLPEKAAPLPPLRVNEAAVAAQAREAHSRRVALWLAAGGGGVAAIALLCALVIPRGARRRWHPAA